MELGSELQANAEEFHVDSPERIARKLLTETGQREIRPPNFAILDLFQQIINGLPEQIALVDDQWRILAVNESWATTARSYGYELVPGSNYLEFCEARALEGHKPTGVAAAGIRAMEANGERSFRYIYTGHGAWEGRSFQLCINRLEVGGQSYATITRYDVTELVKLRHLREDFASSLIEGQNLERSRMAREVHDSTMQLLAGLGLSLGQLRRSRRSKATGEIIDEMEEVLGEAQRELRAIAYLAYPPLLKELGLALAVKQLAGGFGRRTGLDISFHSDLILGVSPTAELALYRIVQEALSNVHRHARATQASVALRLRHSVLHVVVADNGVGMPEHLRKGVGLPSMRSRIEELGGRLSIRPGNPGTTVIASIPLHADLRAVGDMALFSGSVLPSDFPFQPVASMPIPPEITGGELRAS